MSATVSEALTSLGIDQWQLSGEPVTEAEFNEAYRRVTGEEEDSGRAILSANPADFGVTWAQITAEQARLDQIAAAMQYRRDREADYTDELSPEGRVLTSVADPLDDTMTATDALMTALDGLIPADKRAAFDAAVASFKATKAKVDEIKARHPPPAQTSRR